MDQDGSSGRTIHFPRLKEIYSKLLEADLAIKTGKMDGDVVLSILIAELAGEATPAK